MISKEEIAKSYEKLCTDAGDIQYRMRQHKTRLKEINEEIDNLNILMGNLKKIEQRSILQNAAKKAREK